MGRPLALWILGGGLGGMCLGMGMERDGCHEAQARIHGHHEAWKLGVCSQKAVNIVAQQNAHSKKDNAVSCLCFRLVHRRRVKKRINAWVNHKGNVDDSVHYGTGNPKSRIGIIGRTKKEKISATSFEIAYFVLADFTVYVFQIFHNLPWLPTSVARGRALPELP